MASNFDPNESDLISEINITPFVDVVLVLLVIFMVTAPMMVKEVIGIKLPKSKSTAKSEQKTYSVAISKIGQIVLNGDIVDKDLLLERLKEENDRTENLQVIISADKETMHGDVIVVVDQVKSAGISNFAFQVEKIINE